MANWINPDRGELFFATKVVLVEGETERVIFPYLANRLGCYQRSISVIDCGGKYNLELYIHILIGFAINYVVVHDEDPIPDPVPCWSEDRLRQSQKTYQLNKLIQREIDQRFGLVEMIAGDFERFSDIPKSQGDKKGKALAALDHFDTLGDNDIPAGVTELVKRIYDD